MKLEWDKFDLAIDESWHRDLRPWIESEECYNIYQKLKALPKGEVIPKSNLLWKPFLNCKKDNLKVVFMGLSPYHTRNNNQDYADGLAFSTQLKKTPPNVPVNELYTQNDKVTVLALEVPHAKSAMLNPSMR